MGSTLPTCQVNNTWQHGSQLIVDNSILECPGRLVTLKTLCHMSKIRSQHLQTVILAKWYEPFRVEMHGRGQDLNGLSWGDGEKKELERELA